MKHPAAFFAAILFAVSFGIYSGTFKYGFVDYDDGGYITQNEPVKTGLNRASLLHVLGREYASQTATWHPLTSLTNLAEISLFGVNPGAMRALNALVHAANAVLLFAFLRMWGASPGAERRRRHPAAPAASADARGISACAADALPAFVAAAFWAWHPLRVESVAWISSRKDLVCLLFFIPALMSTLRGLRGGRARHRACAFACFLLAFCGKPTAIVFPLLAVLLELFETGRVSWKNNVLNFYAMAMMALVVVWSQSSGNAVPSGASDDLVRLPQRVENAIAAIGRYALATAAPRGLCPLYRHVFPIPAGQALAGSAVLLLTAWLALKRAPPLLRAAAPDASNPRAAPPDAPPDAPSNPRAADGAALWLEKRNERGLEMELLFGFMFFLVALAPVLGFVQVGYASAADRFTYLPGLGLSAALFAALRRADHLAKPNAWRIPAFAALAALCVFAIRQTRIWADTESMFEQSVSVDPANFYALDGLAVQYLKQDRFEDALKISHLALRRQYQESGKSHKNLMEADRSISACIAFSGLYGAPIEKTEYGFATIYEKNELIFKTAVPDDDPLFKEKLFIQGASAYAQGKPLLARGYLQRLTESAPDDDCAWRLLGMAHEKLGAPKEAMQSYERSLALSPDKHLARHLRRMNATDAKRHAQPRR